MMQTGGGYSEEVSICITDLMAASIFRFPLQESFTTAWKPDALSSVFTDNLLATCRTV